MSVDEFWSRMSGLSLDGVFDTLRPLPPERRDDPFFGVNAALSERSWVAPAMKGSGAALDRVQIRWDDLEPAPGEFRFEAMDGIFDDAARWHVQVLAVVDGAPAWAVDRPARVGPGPPRGLDAPPLLSDGAPNPDNPWAVFVAAVARRYGRQIVAWEIWNEPNLPEFWAGTPADYARLLQAARVVLREDAPGVPVVFAGMVEDDGKFLGNVLATLCPNHVCGAPPFDGVAWHVYNDPAGVTRVALHTREVLALYHVQAELWITEANVAVDDPNAPGTALMPEPRVSLGQQAAFIVQLVALARAEGVRSVEVYRATDIVEAYHFWGLIRGDESPRPALLAYRTAAFWLDGSTFVSRSRPTPSTTRITLNRGEDEIDVLWTNGDQPVTVRLSAPAARGMLITPSGARTPISATNGAFAVPLQGAPRPRPSGAAPLAAPIILVVPAPP